MQRLIPFRGALVAFLFIAAMAASHAQPAPQPAARVLLAIGTVEAVAPDGTARALGRGDPIFEGETLRTDRSGRAQIRFTDGARMSLRPETVLDVDDYEYAEQAQPSTLRTSLNLRSGGFRTATGAVADRNRDAYRVRTPLAVIGVRGTDWSAAVAPPGRGGPPVVLTGVEGGITVTNNAGTFTYDFTTPPPGSGGTPAPGATPPAGGTPAGGGGQSTSGATRQPAFFVTVESADAPPVVTDSPPPGLATTFDDPLPPPDDDGAGPAPTDDAPPPPEGRAGPGDDDGGDDDASGPEGDGGGGSDGDGEGGSASAGAGGSGDGSSEGSGGGGSTGGTASGGEGVAIDLGGEGSDVGGEAFEFEIGQNCF